MVKYNNEVSNNFSCYFGIRQGECLSYFLFAMYLNDIEDVFIRNKFLVAHVDKIKLFLLLHANDIFILSESGRIYKMSESGPALQNGLVILYEYCQV